MGVRLACALLLWLSLELPAAAPQRGLEGYSRRIWQTQDGLPEEPVQAFAQTPDGYLWIGTEGGGLVRCRRGTFQRLSAEEGLANGFVRSVLEDRRGQLWVGTDDGLFRLQGDRLSRVDG